VFAACVGYLQLILSPVSLRHLTFLVDLARWLSLTEAHMQAEQGRFSWLKELLFLGLVLALVVVFVDSIKD